MVKLAMPAAAAHLQSGRREQAPPLQVGPCSSSRGGLACVERLLHHQASSTESGMLSSTKLSYCSWPAKQTAQNMQQHQRTSAGQLHSSKRYSRVVILQSSPRNEVALSKEEPASRSAAQKSSVNC